ncbi:MAG: carboxypeptidase regulatory-like domain-containing protein, partial [Acidobacteriota bacterium]
MSRRCIAWWFVVCLVLFGAPLGAQQPTGSITGMVTDPSAAVIPGAAVTVTNKATDMTLKLSTTAAGVYTASSLLPGAYEVRVEAQGFKTAVLELTVEVGRVTPADVRLEVGPVSTTVTVQAHAVVVNPTQTTLEGVITDNLIRALPLNGRNFLDLGQLEPGVQLQDGAVLTPTKCQYTNLSIGNQSGEGTRITVDGLDISDEIVGTTTMNISQDSIQEFQISRSKLDISTSLTG